LSVSKFDDLAHGAFHEVIGEVDDLPGEAIDRVVFCSGKVYFDLLEQRRAADVRNVAIVRIEQLYPFPAEDYAVALARYPNAREIVWCQEEPQNQGAWYQVRHRLQEPLKGQQELLYSGRRPAAAPATGIAQMHATEQHGLVTAALSASTKERTSRATARLRATGTSRKKS
jgi:2-oxoglutarate dehydrogenase E1 component